MFAVSEVGKLLEIFYLHMHGLNGTVGSLTSPLTNLLMGQMLCLWSEIATFIVRLQETMSVSQRYRAVSQSRIGSQRECIFSTLAQLVRMVASMQRMDVNKSDSLPSIIVCVWIADIIIVGTVAVSIFFKYFCKRNV